MNIKNQSTKWRAERRIIKNIYRFFSSASNIFILVDSLVIRSATIWSNPTVTQTMNRPNAALCRWMKKKNKRMGSTVCHQIAIQSQGRAERNTQNGLVRIRNRKIARKKSKSFLNHQKILFHRDVGTFARCQTLFACLFIILAFHMWFRLSWPPIVSRPSRHFAQSLCAFARQFVC